MHKTANDKMSVGDYLLTSLLFAVLWPIVIVLGSVGVACWGYDSLIEKLRA